MRKKIFGLAVFLLIAVLVEESLRSQHPSPLMHFLIEDVFETLIIVILDFINSVASIFR